MAHPTPERIPTMELIGMGVEVECNVCGHTLAINSSVDRYGKVTIDVEPCETCMAQAHTDGYLVAEQEYRH
jgi:hypothetical protein